MLYLFLESTCVAFAKPLISPTVMAYAKGSDLEIQHPRCISSILILHMAVHLYTSVVVTFLIL